MEWLLSLFLWQPNPDLVYKNNQALSYLEGEQKAVAIPEFSNLLQTYGDQPNLLWNLSLAFIVNERFQEAHKILDFMLKEYIADPSMQNFLFFVYYNKAKVFAAEKKTKEAIDNYLEALRIRQNSKEVVVNIELLNQQKQGGGDSGQNQEQKKQENKEQKQDQQEEKQDKPESKKQGQKQPKPFDSKDLSKEDVRRILDELKRQEEKIREKIQDKQPKQKSHGKDW